MHAHLRKKRPFNIQDTHFTEFSSLQKLGQQLVRINESCAVLQFRFLIPIGNLAKNEGMQVKKLLKESSS